VTAERQAGAPEGGADLAPGTGDAAGAEPAEPPEAATPTRAEIAAVGTRRVSVARARLEALFDAGSFDEIGDRVLHRCDNFGLAERRFPGDGVVTGVGLVDGRTVYAYAQDSRVLGGSLGHEHAMKIARLMDLAGESGSPLVGINDSGGARIQEGVESLAGYGEIFRRNVKYSGVIPQISVICGPCAGGAVYSPALTDVVVMVEGSSYMFLTGPKVVQSVTFEEVTAEALGGARCHAEQTGVASLLYGSDLEALAGVRALLDYLPDSYRSAPRRREGWQERDPLERLGASVTAGFPQSPRTPYDVRTIIDGVVDRGSFFELHALWAKNLVVGFARLAGRVVGVVANQPLELAGCLDIDASRKGARFIRTCNAFNIPLVSLVDVPGFLPGTAQEHRGVIDHGAKLLYAYCEATVPKLSVITRKAFGGAYIVMSSKHVGGDVNLAWPTAQIAVMGAKGAVEVLFRRQIAEAADPVAFQAQAQAEYEETFLNPGQATALGFIDAVIEPAETRRKLGRFLLRLEGKREPWPERRNGNMPT
jgi:acetyl-CoA carboxylase carboxyltransferase component